MERMKGIERINGYETGEYRWTIDTQMGGLTDHLSRVG